MKKSLSKLRELAFYYPNPMWSYGDWIKNLVLFFDGIALLVPKYMKRRPEEIDPAIVAGLKQHGLLEIIEPEKAVDKTATEKLDDLAKDQTAFAELSMSRLGYYGDEGLYKMIFEELKNRGLARDSEDEVSIPMHPKVRSLVLVFLSQILRPYGSKLNARLSPTTDMGNNGPRPHRADRCQDESNSWGGRRVRPQHCDGRSRTDPNR